MTDDEQRFAIGEAHAGGRIDVVYDHDCPSGHVIRGAMHVIPCPYCLQGQNAKLLDLLAALRGHRPVTADDIAAAEAALKEAKHGAG